MEDNAFIPIDQQNSVQSLPQVTPQEQKVYERIAQSERVSNFLSQTSPTKTLESIDYMLKGFIYDRENNEWKKVSQGIPESIRLDFLQQITPDLSDDARMTCLDKEQINGIMEFIIEWSVDYLDSVADKFNLSETDMTKIFLIMTKAVFYTLLRSQNGVERGEIFNSLSMGENLTPQMQQGGNQWWKFWK